jgi:DNA-binding LytR/AlgR family response regulator
MSDRRVVGTGASEVRIEALSGLRRTSGLSAAAATGAERDADKTLESLRRRRDSTKVRALNGKSSALSRVLVGERERRLYLLSPGEIDYIESRANYVEFHTDGLVFISRDSVKRLSRVLAGSGYIRIRRTLLLNIQSILYAQRVGHGTYAFTLSSGTCLRSGARYREEILRILPLTRARRVAGR